MNLLLLIPQQSFFREAVRFAEIFAQRANMRLHILGVVRSEGSRSAGEQTLTEVEKCFDSIQPASRRLKIDDALTAMKETIDELAISMVMVAAGKETSLRPLPLDTTINKLVSHSPVPIMVVRKPASRLERILICTGGTARADDAIQTGAELAKRLEANATLLYVSSTVPSMYTGLDQMDESLQEILDSDTPLAHHLHRGAEIFEQLNVMGKLELRHGVPFEAILTAVEEDQADLVVMGASRVGKNVRNWLLGNVSKQVLERSPAPILVVHIGQNLA